MRRYPIAPFVGLVALALATLAGGIYNTVEARGRVVHDWTGEPLQVTVSYGQRSVTTDESGAFDLGLVPREAQLTARKQGFEAQRFGPEQHEVRLAPGGITLRVQDAQGKGINGVEARKDTAVISQSPGSVMIVTPHPGPDAPFIVCAKEFGPKEVKTTATSLEVTLDKGPGCPPLPSPSPSPGASPTPSPGAAPTPSPGASPTPTPSPTGSP